MNEFVMNDGNTYYLVNGLRKRTKVVQENPDVLKYNVWESERRESADMLLQRALKKVRGSGDARKLHKVGLLCVEIPFGEQKTCPASVSIPLVGQCFICFHFLFAFCFRFDLFLFYILVNTLDNSVYLNGCCI